MTARGGTRPPANRGRREVYGDADRPAIGDIVHASDGRNYRVVERKSKRRIRGLDISPGPRRVLDLDVIPRCNKRQFPSQAAAEEALLSARIAQTLRQRARRRETRAYPCPDPGCDGAWHLTSLGRWADTPKETE